jgi:hypothetical protein
MEWKPDTPLRQDQTAHAVMWRATLTELGYGDLVTLPEPPDDWYKGFWNDRGKSARLKTFGHTRAKDSTTPHFVCTRGGLGWHTDPGYTRYALQIQLANPGGYAVVGFGEPIESTPLCLPGLVHLLDTWSPHRVARDPRLPARHPNKLLCGMDFDTIGFTAADLDREIARLVAHIPRFPL